MSVFYSFSSLRVFYRGNNRKWQKLCWRFGIVSISFPFCLGSEASRVVVDGLRSGLDGLAVVVEECARLWKSPRGIFPLVFFRCRFSASWKETRGRSKDKKCRKKTETKEEESNSSSTKTIAAITSAAATLRSASSRRNFSPCRKVWATRQRTTF